MSAGDPSAWLTCALAIFSFVAMLPWRIDGGALVRDGSVWRLAILVALGAAMLLINWVVGGTWMIMLSQMAQPSDEHDLFAC